MSTGLYTTQMCEYLAELDHEVTVLCGQPYFPNWAIYGGWSKFRYTKRDHGKIDVTHCPHYVPRNPTGIRRIIHHTSFAFAILPILIWYSLTKRFDLVTVVAPSLMSAPFALAFAKVSGARSHLHVQDFEVEAAFATKLIDPETLLGRAALRFEKCCLKRFNLVTTISPKMLLKLHQKGVTPDKTYELRNWADTSRIKPQEPSQSFKKEIRISTEYVALYSGNIGNKQGIGIIVEAAKLLSHRTDLTFLICGNGPALTDLKRKALGLPNVRFIDLQPHERLSDLLSIANIHLMPQIADAADLLLPSKLTNMFASERPIVATAARGTGLADEIKGVGIATPPGDPPKFARAIEQFLNDKELRAEMGKKARLIALTRWEKNSILTRFEARLHELLGTSKRKGKPRGNPRT